MASQDESNYQPSFPHHQVTLYVGNQRIIGELDPSPQRRLSDLLNERGYSFITLNRGQITLSDGGNGVAMQVPFVCVNRDEIVLAFHTYEAEAPNGDDYLRIRKVVYRIVLCTNAFSITGSLHLIEGADLRERINQFRDNFISLTDAIIYSLRHPTTVMAQTPYISVNKAHIISIFPEPE